MPPHEDAPRFAADRMLGRLARWLRILGFDVAYAPQLTGEVLLQLALREGRVMLTRDTRLLRRRPLPPHLFVVADRFREQLLQVARAFSLNVHARLLSRCVECNRELVQVERQAVHGRVPPYVWASQSRFRRCPRCGRLYWNGTHRAHILDELRRLGLGAEPRGGAASPH